MEFEKILKKIGLELVNEFETQFEKIEGISYKEYMFNNDSVKSYNAYQEIIEQFQNVSGIIVWIYFEGIVEGIKRSLTNQQNRLKDKFENKEIIN